jgi:hypothetical protein
MLYFLRKRTYFNGGKIYHDHRKFLSTNLRYKIHNRAIFDEYVKKEAEHYVFDLEKYENLKKNILEFKTDIVNAYVDEYSIYTDPLNMTQTQVEKIYFFINILY